MKLIFDMQGENPTIDIQRDNQPIWLEDLSHHEICEIVDAMSFFVDMMKSEFLPHCDCKNCTCKNETSK